MSAPEQRSWRHTLALLERSKMRWVALLYFAEGFPLGVFYEIFPVYFRQNGVELKSIGALSLLGLAWTLKYLWAPAVDALRRHRWWMAAADVAMGGVLLAFSVQAGLGPWVWGAIALFTLLSATNDIAIDGYTIEYLARDEMGLANGIRIGFYRVGMLATGAVLVIADHWSWRLAFLVTALVLFAAAAACLAAPREAERAAAAQRLRLGAELSTVARDAWASALVLAFFLGALALADKAIGLGAAWPDLWRIAGAGALLVWLALRLLPSTSTPTRLRDGPLFGALFALLARPGIAQVLAFILLFKLADAAMGFMVKPFWVDRGFSAAEIGLVSVNLGLLLSIAGGVCGGLYCDRAGIFRALWLLGLAQAASNLGYAAAAWYVPPPQPGIAMALEYQIAVYAASGIESFTGGMGTAAFLAFLMALVNKRAAATEYALLSSVFALSRSVAGWAGGYAAQAWGYAEFFFFSAFLAAPAYLFLPWVRRALDTRTEAAP